MELPSRGRHGKARSPMARGGPHPGRRPGTSSPRRRRGASRSPRVSTWWWGPTGRPLGRNRGPRPSTTSWLAGIRGTRPSSSSRLQPANGGGAPSNDSDRCARGSPRSSSHIRWGDPLPSPVRRRSAASRPALSVERIERTNPSRGLVDLSGDETMDEVIHESVERRRLLRFWIQPAPPVAETRIHASCE
jgi:hypothetical protein